MAIKEGWQGRVFEDFEAGDVDAACASRTEWGRPPVDSLNAVNLGWDEVRRPEPGR